MFSKERVLIEGSTVARTIFELIDGLQNLSYRHPNFLLCEAIQPLQGVLNIRPS